MRKLYLIFLLVLVFDINLSAKPNLLVAGIQLCIDERMYESTDSFSRALDREIRRAILSVPDESRPDVIVFPEYTSVFLSLVPYYDQIRRSDSVAGALDAICADMNTSLGVRRLFLKEAVRVEKEMDRIWGGLAEKYRVVLLAGTYFAESDGELYNRLAVYGREGGRIYQQDKVFLTDFELGIIGLAPGLLDDAALWEVNGFFIAATICRDTFFDAWNGRFSNADYWIDIKANGTAFTDVEANRFMRALPQRIGDTGVGGGITVCLTGSYLDLFWEGLSFAVFRSNGEVLIGNTAGNPRVGTFFIDTGSRSPLSDRKR